MSRAVRLLPLLFLLLLAPAANASARPVPIEPPARVQIGHAALGKTADGPSILVPVTYPIQLAGQEAPLEVTLLDRSGSRIFRRVVRIRLDAGEPHRPERRRAFVFVHRVDLSDRPAVQLEQGMRVLVRARGRLDANADGKPELSSADRVAQALPLDPSRFLCSTPSVTRTRPGRRTTVPLPACTTKRPWRVVQQPDNGQARVEGGSLVYRSGPRFRGTDTLVLSGARHVRFTVGQQGEVVVRALGDSVTAGFGYYGNGRPMTIGRLLECRPPERKYDDACSSNSLNASNRATEVVYAPDYGLSNNVSWAAQWANEHGVADYANFAVSGSAPADWAPGGQLHETTERIEAEDPDYVLMTMGANPLLSEMLFGLDNMGCAIYSQIVGGYSECVERAFAEVELRQNLKNLYADLAQHTDATIYLMQYHLSVPSVALAYSATQIAEMGQLLNREIASVAAEVNPKRLQVVTPPHFNVGIDISPVYPSTFTCSRWGYLVDGPSVQSTPTQDELEVLHPLSFCAGPEDGASPSGSAPWVISGDTGIHPSAAGYAQMAAQVPPPGN